MWDAVLLSDGSSFQICVWTHLLQAKEGETIWLVMACYECTVQNPGFVMVARGAERRDRAISEELMHGGVFVQKRRSQQGKVKPHYAGKQQQKKKLRC